MIGGMMSQERSLSFGSEASEWWSEDWSGEWGQEGGSGGQEGAQFERFVVVAGCGWACHR